MFSFLKDKIKKAISKITKRIEEAPEVKEEKEIPKEEIKEEKIEPIKEVKEKIKKVRKEKKEVKKVEEEVIPEVKEITKEEEKVKGKTIFEKVKEKFVAKKISEAEFDKLFWDLELALLENNVAVEVIEKIKEDLKNRLTKEPIRRREIENIIKETLKETLNNLFELPKFNLIQEIKLKEEKPYIIIFVGVNGSGKTTTIAKIANLLKEKNIKCVLVAGDSWRSAAIEQLEEWGKKLKLKVIKHQYGSDPAAIAFDGRKYGEAHNLDVILIDTAGRQHANVNLMEEMKKIVKVVKPDLKLFVGEAIVGNDAVEQSKQFNDAIGIDGIILAKADIDEKGGAMISISHVTKKPILFLGTGQGLKDLERFDKEKIIKGIGL